MIKLNESELKKIIREAVGQAMGNMTGNNIQQMAQQSNTQAEDDDETMSNWLEIAKLLNKMNNGMQAWLPRLKNVAYAKEVCRSLLIHCEHLSDLLHQNSRLINNGGVEDPLL